MKVRIKGIETDLTEKDLKKIITKLEKMFDVEEYDRDVRSLFAEIIKRIEQIEADKKLERL